MTDISKEPRSEQKELAIANTEGDLFQRVASILEEARANAVRASLDAIDEKLSEAVRLARR